MNKRNVNGGLTRKSPRDLSEYVPMVRRVIRALGRRVADADPEDLAGLLGLHEVVEDAITVAINGQRTAGFSWADIGRGLGTTRQNAFQRYGRQVTS